MGLFLVSGHIVLIKFISLYSKNIMDTAIIRHAIKEIYFQYEKDKGKEN